MSGPSPVASSDASSQASWTSSATVISTNSATSSAQLSTGSGPSPTYSSHAEASQGQQNTSHPPMAATKLMLGINVNFWLALDTGYVSPYPPLPPSTTVSAGRPITSTTAITPTQIHEAQSSSAPTEQAQTQGIENVREYTLPRWPRQRFLYPFFRTMLDARTITQVGPQIRVVFLSVPHFPLSISICTSSCRFIYIALSIITSVLPLLLYLAQAQWLQLTIPTRRLRSRL